MKQLTITLTLPLELDYFGLHTVPDGTREWLGLLRTGAEEHGCTVAMEVEDVKGLRKAPGRRIKPTSRTREAVARLDKQDGAMNMVPNDAA
jgi:hypothetical protein